MKRPPVPPQVSAPSLAERIELLSAKRQEIIRPILEHPRDYVLLSVRAMAKRLKTDPATVVRIVRGLGFESYRDFQRHLHDLSIAFATSLDTMQSAGKVTSTSMPAYVRDALEQDLKNLHGLKNSLDAPRLVSLAKRFYDARRIVLLAGDLAAILADYLEYQITLLGLPVFTGHVRGPDRPPCPHGKQIAISSSPSASAAGFAKPWKAYTWPAPAAHTVWASPIRISLRSLASATKSSSPASSPLLSAPPIPPQLPWSTPSWPLAASTGGRKRSPSSKKSPKSSAKASAGTPSDGLLGILQQTFLASIV